MVKPDESFDKAEDEELQIKPFNKKKVLIYVVPVIVVIGLAVSFITVFTRKDHLGGEGDFSIVTTAGEGEDARKNNRFLHASRVVRPLALICRNVIKRQSKNQH